MAYLTTILLTILCLFFAICFLLKQSKSNFTKYEILENDPSLTTLDYDQHVRRLNKFRTSKYKGITYFFSKKGGLYFYSKNNVRIYI